MSKCPTCGHVTERVTLDGFDEFWEVFADKRGRGSAERAWIKNECSNISEDVIAGAKDYSYARDRTYKQLPATWLNDKGWLNEYDVPEKDIQKIYTNLIGKYGNDAVIKACQAIAKREGLSLADDKVKIFDLVPDEIKGNSC